MIKISHLTKIYTTSTGSVAALDHIDLQVGAGEIYGIIGRSGAGKSTLIRCVNLLEKPTSGDVIVNQENLMNLSAARLRLARRKMGMIFQHFNLLSSRTVYDNVALPLELCHFSAKQIADRIHPLLELTGLSHKKNAYPSQLSGGQKQRVAIARALACEPTVLLSDEATSALDPETTTMILQLLKDIRAALNITILLITHEMSVIKACCDRVAILEQGKLIEENEVGEFFAHPKTALAKNFIVASLPQALPQFIAQHMHDQSERNSYPILRLWFFGNTATQPIISQLINQFNLRLNILLANMEYIKKHAMGVMILAVAGEPDNLTAGILYLEQIGVYIEVLGYVPSNIISFT